MTAPIAPARLRASPRDRVMITPEGIALPVTIASRAVRAGALVLDLICILGLIAGLTVLLAYVAGGTFKLLRHAQDNTALGHALQFLFVAWLAAMFLLRNAYFLFFELSPRGATPGKRLTGIRIAARDGGHLSAEMVIARNLLRDIELFVPLVLLAMLGSDNLGPASLAAVAWFLIFAGMPLFNRDALRAGDIVAGTWVVEAPRRQLQPVLSSHEEPSPQYAFTEAELAVYGEYELQTLERLLREDRDEALDAVHQTIAGKIGRPARAGEARAFLAAYYRQLRARLEAGMRLGRRKADKFD